MKFKVGDKVVINEKCTAYKDLVGKHGTVADVIEGRCKVEVGNDEYVWITDEVLSLDKSPDNSMKLKVGDLVIVSGNVPHYGGCRGKVTDVYGVVIKTYVVELVKNGERHSRAFLADELVLDNDELRRIDAKMIKHFGHVRWEAGDKVIVVSNCYGPKVYGMKGKVEKIDNFGSCYVMLDCGEGRCEGLWFDSKELSRDISGVEQRISGSDVWRVNMAELAGRTVSGCGGLAFGEEM